jgi:aminotransferase
MISVFGSLVGEEEIEAVAAVMRSQWMGFGKKVDEFEEAYKLKFNISNFALVDSGSNALYMAVKLLNLPSGSKVIVPSFTWVSCAQAVLLAGCVPVFCDVDIVSMNVTKATIESVLDVDVKAIMVVHYAGLPVEMDEILKIGLPVIEDAAHAVNSLYHGIACGIIGDIGIYSYDAVKNLTVGEGGGIASKDKALIDRAKRLRYCGIGKSGFDSAGQDESKKWWEYNISEPFIKMLPTNIAAAIGIEQLKKIDSLQAHREVIWNFYCENLCDLSNIRLPMNAPEYSRHSYFTYCIRAPRRDELAKYLLSQGIYTTLRYHPLHLNPLYNQLSHRLPNSEQLNVDALSLPLHPRLSLEEANRVVASIRNFYLY